MILLNVAPTVAYEMDVKILDKFIVLDATESLMDIIPNL